MPGCEVFQIGAPHSTISPSLRSAAEIEVWNGTSFNLAIVAADGSHPGSAPGTAYLVFHVGDYDAFVAERAAKGLTPFAVSADEYGRFAKYRDPEGNEVDVWGRPDGAAPSAAAKE